MSKYKWLILVISVLLACILWTTGCRVVLVPADEKIEPGELETRQFDFDEFTDVDISSAFSYEIQQADDWSISITAGRNLFDYIDVTVSGQELDIEMDFPSGTFWPNHSYSRPKALITMPELKSLSSSGATEGNVIGFSFDYDLDISLDGACKVELSEISAGRVLMDVSGASKVTGQIQADTIKLDVSSASMVNLEGSAGDVVLYAQGVSRADLADFIAQNIDATLRDASSGTVNLDGKLDVRLSGVSTLEYFGEPVIGTLEITGASTFRKK